MTTFAAELVMLQNVLCVMLTGLYTHELTGDEAVAVLAGWDGSRWVPSAFSLLTALPLNLSLVPPPSFHPADQGTTPVLCRVCTEEALLGAFRDYERAVTAVGGA